MRLAAKALERGLPCGRFFTGRRPLFPKSAPALVVSSFASRERDVCGRAEREEERDR